MTERSHTGIPPAATVPPYRRLRRPTTDRIIAGVASGVGRYLNLDPTVVRVIFALAGLATGGLALVAYPVIWFLMPEEPADAPAWPYPAATGYPTGPGTADPPHPGGAGTAASTYPGDGPDRAEPDVGASTTG